jgi:hypothetical protein
MKILKPGKIIVTVSLSIVAIAFANAKESKRFTQNTAYYSCNGTNWHSVTLDVAAFDTKGTATQAAIRDENGAWKLLYLTQATTNPAKFVCS